MQSESINMKSIYKKNPRAARWLIAAFMACSLLGSAAPALAYANCGTISGGVHTNINFGCTGKIKNPIVDLAFAVVRFLSNGVGIVVVGSVVYAGIQYTMARDDPSAVSAARNRIRSSLSALLIFIFAYAILNYLIPNQFLS